MKKSSLWPLLGTLTAIAITATMDATGYTAFSALPLAPLLALLWYAQRMSRVEVGFTWGRRGDYVPAVLYPLVVIGAATLAAAIGGAIDTSDTNWQHFWINLLAGGLSTILGALITEEGFFRGWLWAALRRIGCSNPRTLVATSVAFTIWHLSAVVLPTGYDLPPAQLPIYLVNATLLGLIWGMLRLGSGSVIVASVSHGIWNGMAYALFAFGTKTGALGVADVWIYGPERGLIGILLNSLYAALLWRWVRARQT